MMRCQSLKFPVQGVGEKVSCSEPSAQEGRGTYSFKGPTVESAFPLGRAEVSKLAVVLG